MATSNTPQDTLIQKESRFKHSQAQAEQHQKLVNVNINCAIAACESQRESTRSSARARRTTFNWEVFEKGSDSLLHNLKDSFPLAHARELPSFNVPSLNVPWVPAV